MKQQPHILILFEVLSSAFSLFEEQAQAFSAYCHFHSFLNFQKKPHRTGKQRSRLLALELLDIVYHKILGHVQTLPRTILSRNRSPGVSNLQRGWSFEQIFDSSKTFLSPLVRTNSLYEKRTVRFSFSPLTSPCETLTLFLRCAKPVLRKKNRLFCSVKNYPRCLERVYTLNVRVKIYSTGLQKYS